MSTTQQTYKENDPVPDTMIPPCISGETFSQCESQLKKQLNIAQLNSILNSGVLSSTSLNLAQRDYDAFLRCAETPNEKCIVDKTSIWEYLIPILIFLMVLVLIIKGKDILYFFKRKFSKRF